MSKQFKEGSDFEAAAKVLLGESYPGQKEGEEITKKAKAIQRGRDYKTIKSAIKDLKKLMGSTGRPFIQNVIDVVDQDQIAEAIETLWELEEKWSKIEEDIDDQTMEI